MFSKAVVATAAIAGLLTPALADFWIYAEVSYSVDDGGGSVRSDGYAFFNGQPDCSDVQGSIFQPGHDDVSGSKSGVRCSGCASGDSDTGNGDPTELEWNNGMGHFTWYANRNGDFVDLDGNVKGNCVVDSGDSYQCAIPPIGTPNTGLSQLHCTSDLNADGVNS